MSETYSIGSVTSVHKSHANDISLKDYDLVLATATWETRGELFFTKFTKSSLKKSNVSIFYFRSMNGDTTKRKEKFLEFLESKLGKKPRIWELDRSIDVDSNFAKIKSRISDLRKSLKRPVNILCDISCLPKSYILYLIGLSFNGEFGSRLTLFYAEAEKYEMKKGKRFSSRSNLMSSGDWQLVLIPYFEPDDLITEGSELLLSLGAEIKACIAMIERIEPKSLRVSTISHFTEKIPKNVAKREVPFLKSIAQNYGANISEFELCAVHPLTRWIDLNCNSTTQSLIIGPKLHAVGIAIAALSKSNVQINCRIPNSYSLTNVAPSGEIHTVDIIDRFDPRNYM